MNVAPAYDRAFFTHWIDEDSDGCDTRAEVLMAESLVPVTMAAGCTITAGQWYSRYDGATWTAASDVDIDHMVPLAEAWRSVAWSWTDAQRQAFANDLGFEHSLEAVTDNVNQSKGDQDPASWLPALDQCQYAIDWVTVKWRWNIGVDTNERAALAGLLNGTTCGSTPVAVPQRMIGLDSTKTWPLYKIVYDASIYELVTNQDGSQTPVALSFDKWRDVYAFQQSAAAATDFVKYAWSPTVYAVTFWPGGESSWMWTPLFYPQWLTAGRPAPRLSGWIQGSYYYGWGTGDEIFVQGADGVRHKLTAQEWAASGYRAFDTRGNSGFMKLSWANEFAFMSDLTSGAGRPVGFAAWQAEAFPTPAVRQRITGDQFYREYGNSTIWYACPGMNRPVSYGEWAAAGFPAPSVRNAPANPGNAVNCTDFSTWSAAQNWFDTYYPLYGDIAGLDSDGDRIACEWLPGHP